MASEIDLSLCRILWGQSELVPSIAALADKRIEYINTLAQAYGLSYDEAARRYQRFCASQPNSDSTCYYYLMSGTPEAFKAMTQD